MRGLVIGCVAPEAARGGPVALVADGDGSISLGARQLDLDVPAADVLCKRLGTCVPPAPTVTRGYLKFHAEHVAPASEGAVMPRL